jgi:predicted dehydrogenase
VDTLYLPSFAADPRAAVVAVCGRNRERAEAVAKQYEVPRVYTDYREMIEKGGLDAIVVSAPDDLHYRMTMDALDAGLHVLCEKPLALNATQAREMVEKAEQAGVKHMVFFAWRWMPHFQYTKQLIDEGYVGRGYHTQFHFFAGFGRNRNYNWRYDRTRANGLIGDLGSHMIDLARWYLGDVRRVSAHLSTFVERESADGQPLEPNSDSAQLLVEFESGAQGMIYLSALAHVGERGAEVGATLHGEGGTLEVEFTLPSAELRGVRHDEQRIAPIPIPAHLQGTKNTTSLYGALFGGLNKPQAGVRLFIDAILEDRPATPNFYDGWQVQRVVDAAIESDQRRCWVSLQ